MTDSEAFTIPAMQATITAHRRQIAEYSPAAFARVYLPHHFTQPASRLHQELFEMLRQATLKRGQRIAVAAPRGHAKSTVATLAYVLWSVFYGHERHVLIISATSEQAEQHLQNVKAELQGNTRLRADFPQICPTSEAKGRPKPWRRNLILLPNNVLIRALGAGQGVRGTKHGADRPSLILVDDLENQEQCESGDQRRKTRDWFNKTLLKAGSDRANVVVVGTVVHYDSLLANLTEPRLQRNKGVGWTREIYRAVETWSDRSDLWDRWEQIRFGEDNFEGGSGPEASTAYFESNRDAMLEGTGVLWPERENYLQLMTLRADEGRLGFQSEKQNEPLDPDECIFSESSLKFWDDDYADVAELLASLGLNAQLFGACDPSLGRRVSRGDFTAIVTLVQDSSTKQMYVIDADIARRKPDETINRIVALFQTYSYRAFAFESNQFQEVLADQLHQRLKAINSILTPTQVNHTSHKATRIESLEPLINSGQLRFSRRHQLLLEQMRQFPLGAHDDGPDALEMVVEIARKRRVIGGTRPIM